MKRKLPPAYSCWVAFDSCGYPLCICQSRDGLQHLQVSRSGTGVSISRMVPASAVREAVIRERKKWLRLALEQSSVKP